MLISRGADTNVGVKHKDMALSIASMYNEDLARRLIDNGADINTRDNDNTMLLIKAANKGVVEIAKLLLDKGATFNYDLCRAVCENTSKKVSQRYLTKDELRILMTAELPRKKDELVRDLFIFCAFTGLAFSDMCNLTQDSIKTSFDGNLWILIERQKTRKQCNIRLLYVPKKIIEKYQGITSDNKLFAIIRHETANNTIRKIVKLCNIEKYVTWHMSRYI